MGYELRLAGENEEFARYSGSEYRKGYCTFLRSLVVLWQVLAVEWKCSARFTARFTWTSLLGYGWDAIIICTLAKNNPLYTPFAALFLAYLRTGASIMARRHRCNTGNCTDHPGYYHSSGCGRTIPE